MTYILILGAGSDIAKAVARKYANNGYNIYLAARKSDKLKDFASDISIRCNVKVKCLEFDALNYNSHQDFYNNLTEKPLGIVVAVGYLGEQKQAEQDFSQAEKIINTNYTGIVSILNIIANDFEKRKPGFIVAISSVAGDRGRKSNYLYGSAKAALNAYLSGLRNRLNSSNIQVLTVKPGFVATKMTEGMDLPKKLTATPEQVANAIYKAQQKNKNVLYTKWIWRWIMLIIKHIPEAIFKKMSV